MPLSAVGAAMTWGEALRLTRVLLTDPAAQLFAAVQGWKFAISREALALLDLYDLTHRANSEKRPKPHPGRPWAVDKTRRVAKPSIPQDQVRAALAAAGHGRR